MNASAPSPLREIVVLLWPLLLAAVLAEVCYLLRLPAAWRWGFVVVAIPPIVGAASFHRYLGKEKKLRVLWTILYFIGAFFAAAYVLVLVGAANGDAI